ncbi:MAG: putative bifunctional diguanylate cyclase/phosphodiesterase, partial [Burkholderiaceae bacterium]
ADLSGALLRGELSAHFQLQTNASGQPVGAEMLMRWFHPVHGQVSPAEFIPLAEESGAIVEMGEWGLVTACRTLADWSRQPGFESLTLSVNISPRQFTETDFATRLAAVLGSTGAPADKLVLEVTEGIVTANADEVIATMLQVCELGVSFSVDDFGTGYSSLSYLQRLPLREVKIDKAFVGDMMYNSGSEAIVRAILALAHSLGLVVVSEGVETPEQHHMLARMGCDEFQGYLLGRPAMLAT